MELLSLVITLVSKVIFIVLQQEGFGPAENEFDFDGYSMDNIPV